MIDIEKANTARITLKRYGYKQHEVAKILDITLVSMNRKLKGKTPFKPEEWNKILKLRNKFMEVKKA